jgi:hypothetical protein
MCKSKFTLHNNIEARVCGDLPKQLDTKLENFQIPHCKPLNVLSVGLANTSVFNIGYSL